MTRQGNHGPTHLRGDCRTIFDAAIAAADGAAAVRRCLRRDAGDNLRIQGRPIALAPSARVVVIGAGKATARMAAAVEEILGDRIAGGCISVKDGHLAPLDRVRIHEAGHPVPDERAAAAARAVLAAVRGLRRDDLVLCLLSGGGSALLSLPADDISLGALQQTTEELLRCGASIQEINAVRKHLTVATGGQLALAAAPARVVTLLISDVVGDPLDVIASGPTYGDPSTFADALAVLDDHGLRAATPTPIIERLKAGAAGLREETPAPDDPRLDSVEHVVIASNRVALEAAAVAAERLGYDARILSSEVVGDTTTAARQLSDRIAGTVAGGGSQDGGAQDGGAQDGGSQADGRRGICLLEGGETTVKVEGTGIGGRNTHFALESAIALDGVAGCALLAGGSDGTDGPTDAAGAFIDGRTLDRARARGLDARAALADHDSYSFFAQLGDLIKTGPTGTNVMDIRVALIDAG